MVRTKVGRAVVVAACVWAATPGVAEETRAVELRAPRAVWALEDAASWSGAVIGGLSPGAFEGPLVRWRIWNRETRWRTRPLSHLEVRGLVLKTQVAVEALLEALVREDLLDPAGSEALARIRGASSDGWRKESAPAWDPHYSHGGDWRLGVILESGIRIRRDWYCECDQCDAVFHAEIPTGSGMVRVRLADGHHGSSFQFETPTFRIHLSAPMEGEGPLQGWQTSR